MAVNAVDVEPKIVFPCKYPVKVLGTHSDGFVDQITAIVRLHAPELAAKDVSVRMSRNATYCAVTFDLVATGETQLRALNDDLRMLDAVSLVI